MSIATSARPALAPSSEVAPVVRTLLTSRTHSQANRRLARALVWRWVASRWPNLMPTGVAADRPHLDSELPGRSLSVRTSSDGAVWQLSVTHQERPHAPRWRTQAVVADASTADVLSLETACSDPASARVIAPPAVLGSWIERLATDDAGIVLRSQPRLVEDEAQVAEFLRHLTLPERRLPFLVLARKASSRHYGTDPQVLNDAVLGLAHVACLAPVAVLACRAAFGPESSPVQGAVRLYLPGFAAGVDAPLLPLPQGNAASVNQSGRTRPSELRRALRHRLCQLSVNLDPPQHGLDALRLA